DHGDCRFDCRGAACAGRSDQHGADAATSTAPAAKSLVLITDGLPAPQNKPPRPVDEDQDHQPHKRSGRAGLVILVRDDTDACLVPAFPPPACLPTITFVDDSRGFVAWWLFRTIYFMKPPVKVIRNPSRERSYNEPCRMQVGRMPR